MYREEWEWIQKLSGSESMESVDHASDCPMQLFFYELQMAVKALLKQINIPLHQVQHFHFFLLFIINEILQQKLKRSLYMFIETCLCTYIMLMYY